MIGYSIKNFIDNNDKIDPNMYAHLCIPLGLVMVQDKSVPAIEYDDYDDHNTDQSIKEHVFDEMFDKVEYKKKTRKAHKTRKARIA